MVLKKMPGGSWKCFRGMGGPTFTAPLGGQAVQVTAASAARTTGGSAADLATIEKIRQLDIAATLWLRQWKTLHHLDAQQVRRLVGRRWVRLPHCG